MAQKRDTVLNPIIYVRGYAMTRTEIDDTSADPFCGFNLGSTVFRATPDRTKPPRKYIFESPVLRLASDFGYGDVYTDSVRFPTWPTHLTSAHMACSLSGAGDRAA